MKLPCELDIVVLFFFIYSFPLLFLFIGFFLGELYLTEKTFTIWNPSLGLLYLWRIHIICSTTKILFSKTLLVVSGSLKRLLFAKGEHAVRWLKRNKNIFQCLNHWIQIKFIKTLKVSSALNADVNLRNN